MDNPESLGSAHLNPDSNADRPQAVGIATLVEAVEGLHFPVSKDELIAARGDRDVNLTGHEPQRLKVLLLRTEGDRFASLTDLVERLEHAL